MREEFHGIRNADNTATIQWKLLYGWGTINASVWLPSLAELVGIVGKAHETRGCYYSAMQGLNSSEWYYVDAKGGTQFAYFKQYNAAGGPEKLWACGGSHPYWLRSSVFAYTDRANAFNSANGVWHVPSLMQSLAVHPASGDKD